MYDNIIDTMNMKTISFIIIIILVSTFSVFSQTNEAYFTNSMSDQLPSINLITEPLYSINSFDFNGDGFKEIITSDKQGIYMYSYDTQKNQFVKSTISTDYKDAKLIIGSLNETGNHIIVQGKKNSLNLITYFLFDEETKLFVDQNLDIILQSEIRLEEHFQIIDLDKDQLSEIVISTADEKATILKQTNIGEFEILDDWGYPFMNSEWGDYVESGIKFSDVNGDDVLDLIYNGFYDGRTKLVVFYGIDSYTFSSDYQVLVGVASYRNTLIITDFTGDGVDDMVYANFFNDNVKLFTTDGYANLTEIETISIPNINFHYIGSETTDINEDGVLDILLFEKNKASFLLSNNGTYSISNIDIPQVYNTDYYWNDYATSFNDGTSNYIFLYGNFYKYDEELGFSFINQTEPFNNVIDEISIHDFNNDGREDISYNGRIYYKTNNNNFSLKEDTGIPYVVGGLGNGSTGYANKFIDIDSDGDLDLLHAQNEKFWYYENDGDENYELKIDDFEISGRDKLFRVNLIVSDIDGDGLEDLIINNFDDQGNHELKFYRHTNNTLIEMTNFSLPYYSIVKLLNIDEDNEKELIVSAAQDGYSGVYDFNNWSFDKIISLPRDKDSYHDLTSLTPIDIDSDGAYEVIFPRGDILKFSESSYSVVFNLDPFFSSDQEKISSSLQVFDYNNDGKDDILKTLNQPSSTYISQVKLYVNKNDEFEVLNLPTPLNLFAIYRSKFTDVDEDGKMDIIGSGKINGVTTFRILYNDYPEDTTIPVITLEGEVTVTLEVGTSYTDEGVTANDNLDGDITDNIVIINNVDSSVVGEYTITYNVSDANGNVAEEVTRTVNVVDTTVPVITLEGEVTVTLEVGTSYTDEGTTANDNYDGDITDNIVIINNVDKDVVGEYTITYNVSDVNGNVAEEVTRTVNVVDTTVPVITLEGEVTVTLEVGTSYTDEGATANDNYDGDITDNIVIINNVDKDVVGEYTITYNVSDVNGNDAVEVTRTVNVESILSIDDNIKNSFIIYPNPVVDKLFFKGLSNQTKISIYTLLGKLMITKRTENDIDVKKLKSGIYIIKITDSKGETVRKFIKN
jgi:hypothetical protein